MSTCHIYQLHHQIALTARAAASLREELSSGECSMIGRIVRQLRHRWLMSSIESLTWRLRRRY